MQIRQVLKKGVDYFADRETALLDCEVLLACVLGVDRSYLLAHGDIEVGNDLSDLFDQYCRRVNEGEPVAYILGEKEFYGLNFFVDERVLVPRPETEQIVDRVIDFLNANDDGGTRFRILDVGTGSGNIAVSVAKHFEDEQNDLIKEVVALEIDDGAVEVACLNVEQHNVGHKVRVFESDLLEVVEEGEKYDVIVANLPYIGEVENRFVSDSTEKFEPNVALFGGKNGLELYEKMFEQLVAKNVEFGSLIGEFGFAQKDDMEKLLSRFFGQKWRIEPDLAGIDRIFIVNY